MQFEVNVSDVAGITLQLRSYSQVIHAANVRLPCSPGEGMFHSQVNASLLAKNNDLIVAYPSNADDVRRVFGNALISEKPTFVILPKARLWDRQAKLRSSPTEFSATVRCYGEDVTVVTWGNGVVLAEHAVKLILTISVEIIDLCYLNPIDLETIPGQSHVSSMNNLRVASQLQSYPSHIAYVYLELHL